MGWDSQFHQLQIQCQLSGSHTRLLLKNKIHNLIVVMETSQFLEITVQITKKVSSLVNNLGGICTSIHIFYACVKPM